MATHSSVLAWRIPGTGEPGGLPSMGSNRVGHDWSDLGGGGGSFLLAVGWGWELEGVFESVGNVLRLDSDKGPSSQSSDFSSSLVWMWKLNDKESWVPKNWCFWTVVLEKTHESPLDFKEIQQSTLKDRIFIGRTDAAAETPILWPPDAKNWLTGKDPEAGKDWRQEEKGKTEDEMVWWHHWLDGHKFEEAGQGSLACCSPWGRKESNLTEWLNWLTTIKKL